MIRWRLLYSIIAATLFLIMSNVVAQSHPVVDTKDRENLAYMLKSEANDKFYTRDDEANIAKYELTSTTLAASGKH